MANINQVLNYWPAGMVVTQAWLHARGVSKDQARKWARSGWLVRVGHGAYARAGDRLGWEGTVAGLQTLEVGGLPAYWPAGLTALELVQGAHYLPLGSFQLAVWGYPGKRLPRWFEQHDWNSTVNYHSYRLFSGEPRSHLVEHTPAGRDFQLLVSAPEWAALEWLYSLPKSGLFAGETTLTFEGLGTLRPKRLQQALEACRSVQVKRVFLYLAREFGHSWYQKLDLTPINLGQGKRQLCPGGKLDREFQITVPEQLGHGY